ncbi:MAG: LON peptidase substrate-binding domain-containing protein [Planktomarina sp.]
MTFRFDLPDVIPIFPLPGALLLPQVHLPLHIFEPRYLSLIEDCMKTPHRLMGMVQPLANGDLHTVGCVGRLVQFSETDDGRYMITLSGVSRFRIKEEVDGFTPYRRCHVSWADFATDLAEDEQDPGLDRPVLMDKLKRYFSDQKLATDWDSMAQADDALLINSLSVLCPFEPEDKQALLEAPDLSTRREVLVTLIEFALRSSGTEDVMQ